MSFTLFIIIILVMIGYIGILLIRGK